MASSSSTSQYLEVTLAQTYVVYQIETRGDYNTNKWVKKYKLQYYDDSASTWVSVISLSPCPSALGFTGIILECRSPTFLKFDVVIHWVDVH